MVSVREATAEDDETLGALVGSVYIGEGWSPESARERLGNGSWIRAQGTALVCVADNGITGAVVLVLPGDAGRQIGAPTEAEFRLLAVSPAARGMGTGEALVRDVIRRSRGAGFESLVLSTQEGMVAAQRLYARLGFERQPARDWQRPAARMMVFRLPLTSGPKA